MKSDLFTCMLLPVFTHGVGLRDRAETLRRVSKSDQILANNEVIGWNTIQLAIRFLFTWQISDSHL